MDTEISSWAVLKDIPGVAVVACDRETDEEVGRLQYFFIDDETIQFKYIEIPEAYRRRRVGTALLRYLNACHPDMRINPGVRNTAGSAWMQHILDTEKDKVASNGMINIPLRQLAYWPGFNFANAERLAAGAQ